MPELPPSYRVEPDAEFADRLERVLVQQLTAPASARPTEVRRVTVSPPGTTPGNSSTDEDDAVIDLDAMIDARRPFRRRLATRLALGAVAAAVFAVAIVAVTHIENEHEPAVVPPTTVAPPTTTVVSPTTTVVSSAPSSTAPQMWPQSSVEEVRRAQELADAGDPAYTWQVDPRLTSHESDPALTDPALYAYLNTEGAEVVERFLREELGWEQFRFSGEADDVDGPRGLVYLRCAPGATNRLYPDAPAGQAPGGEPCAPTINDLRYEAVKLDLVQPDVRGENGIWVVSGWTPTWFVQTDPSVAEKDARARLDDFLRARVAGHGAEGYLEVLALFGPSEIRLLYATSTGAPYERFEIERVGGALWPYGEMDFKVRLFAEGGKTVVEQDIRLLHKDGSNILYHNVSATRENGQPVRG